MWTDLWLATGQSSSQSCRISYHCVATTFIQDPEGFKSSIILEQYDLPSLFHFPKKNLSCSLCWLMIIGGYTPWFLLNSHVPLFKSFMCAEAKIQGLSRWDWPAQQMASIHRWRMSRRRPGVVCEISWVCWKSIDVSGPWNNLGGLVFVRRVRCFGPMFVWLNMPRNYVRLLDINFCWLKPLIDPYAKVSLAHFGWFSLLPRVPMGPWNVTGTRASSVASLAASSAESAAEKSPGDFHGSSVMKRPMSWEDGYQYVNNGVFSMG